MIRVNRLSTIHPQMHHFYLHHDADRHYFASFVVTEHDEGKKLEVSLFSARYGFPPPGVHWFRDFAAKEFSKGEIVAAVRMAADGSFHPWQRRFRNAA